MGKNREEIESFRKIAETIPEAIVVTDRDSRVIFTNRAACKLVGREYQGEPKISLQDFLCGSSINPPNIPLYENSLTAHQQSISIKKDDGNDLFVKMRTVQWGQFYLIALQDVTREVMLLRSTDLQRREKQATH